eukprot:TRINITY_DN2134_c0_g1_i1.p1 TRINITY_DN2134_c0_g1~~TRINITY_DN2134_c0_g1_i1.p1  ORF type:complete len:230 (+),score=64.05 TRINITY_DN2134_c0_g1_i1:72-761(+)
MSVTLHARLPNGRMLSQDACANETVGEVKVRIASCADLDPGSFSLSLEGEELDDGGKVTAQPLRDGSEVVVVLHKKAAALADLTRMGWGGKTIKDLLAQITHPGTDLTAKDNEYAVVLAAMEAAGLLTCEGVEASLMPFLLLASANGFVKTVSVLLAKQLVDVNHQLEAGSKRTALHMAAAAGRDNIAKLLLQHNADPSLRNIFGETALDFAKAKGHAAIVRLLENHSP